MIIILIRVRPDDAYGEIPIILPTNADVVNSNAPMLISHESLKRMKWPMSFSPYALMIPSVAKTRLTNTHSGHLMIHGMRPSAKLRDELARKNLPIYVTELKLPTRVLSEEEIRQIHAQLGN